MLAACSAGLLHLRAAERLPVQSGVSYLAIGGRRVRVDVYEPALGGRHPAAVLLHGSGGIHAVIESTINRYAEALAEGGVVTFVLHYFDGTDNFAADDSVETANYFRWVHEVSEAVTWVRRRPDVDARRVGLVGHSLGAWLAVGAGALDRRIYRVVLFGGGLEPFLADSIRRMPPALVLHGDSDGVVPLADAKQLVDFLRARHFPVQFHVYPGEEHTFSDSAAADALARAAAFLNPGRRRSSAR